MNEKKLCTMDRIALWYSRAFGAGCSPRAPGTAGSLLAVILAPWLFLPLSLGWRIGVLIFLFISGSLAAGRAETILGKKDPGEVVIDEVLGQWLVLLPLAKTNFITCALAFILFRIFDILKPWPVRASENWLPGGAGVMIDDAFAGLYALVVLQLLLKILPLGPITYVTL